MGFGSGLEWLLRMDGSISFWHLWMFKGYTSWELNADVELFCRQGIWVHEFVECAITGRLLDHYCCYLVVLVPQNSISLDSDSWHSSLSRRSRSPRRLRLNHVYPSPYARCLFFIFISSFLRFRPFLVRDLAIVSRLSKNLAIVSILHIYPTLLIFNAFIYYLLHANLDRGKNYGAIDAVKGDLFVILGACCYGLSNVLEEYLVSKRPLYEVVGQVSPHLHSPPLLPFLSPSSML